MPRPHPWQVRSESLEGGTQHQYVKGSGREIERERNIIVTDNWLAAFPSPPNLRPNPQPRYVSWPGNQTCDISVYEMKPKQLSHTGQGCKWIFMAKINFSYLATPCPALPPRRDLFYLVNYLLSSRRVCWKKKIFSWCLLYYQVFVWLSGHVTNGKSQVARARRRLLGTGDGRRETRSQRRVTSEERPMTWEEIFGGKSRSS